MEIPKGLQQIAKKYIILETSQIMQIKKGTTKTTFNDKGINNYEMSSDAMLVILSDPQILDQLIYILNNNSKSIIEMGKIAYGDISPLIKISKADFAISFYRHYKAGVFNNLENIQEIYEQIIGTVNPYLEEQNGNYEIAVDGVVRIISRSVLINFLLKDYKNYNLKENFEYNGLSKNEFFYILKTYINTEKLTERFIFPEHTGGLIEDIEKDVYANTEYFNKFIKIDDENLLRFELSEELVSSVIGNMPEGLTKLEQSIYVYIKLAQTLTYDADFYGANQTGDEAEKHRNIKRLQTITPNNSQVVCYEFTQLFAKFLASLGINYQIVGYNGMEDLYGMDHTSLKFRVGNTLVNADAVSSIFGSDMYYSKIGGALKGLVCDNVDDAEIAKFNMAYEKVYDYIKQNEPTVYMQDDAFVKFKELYFGLTMQASVPLQEKIDILRQQCLALTMPTMDTIAHMVQASKLVMLTENGENRFERSVISQRVNGKMHPVMIFSIATKNFNDETSQVDYYLFNPQLKIFEPITSHQLESGFSGGTFVYVGTQEHKIPKIKGEIHVK